MDRCLFWNSQGSKKPAKVKYLKRIIRLHNPSFIIRFAPKQTGSCIDILAVKIGYPYFLHCNPVNTHIWLF